jgi:alanine racemase
MTDEHTMAIFEAGVSRTGEMINLSRVVQPTIGLLTNIGEAHNEGFADKEEKIREKLILFQNVDLLIYSPKYLKGYTGEIPGKKHFTWSWDEDADLRLIDDEVLDDKYLFLRAKYMDRDVQCAVPFTDAASVENAICCWATILALGYLPQDADLRLEKLHPIKMRLELKDGINNCSIIDDSYSADISSLAIALDFLKQQNQHNIRSLILSDIPEAGIDPDTLYTQIAQLLENKEVNRFIGVGSEISKHGDKFNIETTFFKDTDHLISNLSSLRLHNETILLKWALKG